jgi:hypothetical protein
MLSVRVRSPYRNASGVSGCGALCSAAGSATQGRVSRIDSHSLPSLSELPRSADTLPGKGLGSRAVRRAARIRALALVTAATSLGLIACNPKRETLKGSDAHYWLERTCGVAMDTDLVVVEGAASFSTAPHGIANFVSATVRLPADRASFALDRLKGNSRLRPVRGLSGIQTFESDPSDSEHRTCQLDEAHGALFFEYRH